MRRSRHALAAVAASLLLAGCGSTGVPEAGDATQGEELFKQKCASCHMLADAGAQGRVGPDLDAAFARSRNEDGFDETTIRGVVRNMIEYPVPPMPDREELGLTDEEADAIATYVATVAAVPGQGPEPADAGGGGSGSATAASGEEVFASAGCGNCHTLAAAGSTAEIGPNLDESSMSVPDAQAKVAQGGGAMPPFEGQLSDAEIQAVAEYVVSARGG